ncbi:MFS transporter [Calidifontibacter terrae]
MSILPRTPLGRDFNLVAGGLGLSMVGDFFQPIALTVALVHDGRSTTELGTLMATLMVARVTFTLIGGVWADRLSPRLVMVASDGVRLMTAATIGVLFATDHASLGALLLLMIITGAASAFFGPAAMSLRPNLVEPDQRKDANAALSIVQGTAAVVGPALGGLVVAATGGAVGFYVNATSYLCSMSAVLLVRRRITRTPSTATFFTDLREGWTTLRERDWLFWGVIAAGVYHLANGVILVVVPVFILRHLGGAHALGWISAAEGAGGLVGSAIAMRTNPRFPLRAGFLALGLMPLWVAGYVWPGLLLTVILTGFIGYAGLMFFDVHWGTAVQDNVPNHLLARVSSWDMLMSFVAMPVGMALAGPLVDATGEKPLLLLCAAILLVAGLAPLALRSTRRLTTLPELQPAAPTMAR